MCRESSGTNQAPVTLPPASAAMGPPSAAPPQAFAESPWLERSLFALDKFADRSVRGIQKLLFPDHNEALAATQQELSMNTAMADLYEKGPLGRARRLRSASYSRPGETPLPCTLPRSHVSLGVCALQNHLVCVPWVFAGVLVAAHSSRATLLCCGYAVLWLRGRLVVGAWQGNRDGDQFHTLGHGSIGIQ